MFTPDQYQLIDFGDGRRLERFAAVTLDRPCPVAEGIQQGDLDLWQRADGRFEKTGNDQGHWTANGELPERWNVSHGAVTFELKCTPVAHLGVFPEQTDNWDWIARQVQAVGEPVSVLNLFAYTGGSTLAALAAGAEVVHVDAARNTVAWARRNAELSGMADRPVRWIAEDAVKFAKRELKRGNRYNAVILDPPSYGHGTRGEVWRLAKHLPRLLQLCGELTAGRRRFVLLTCHTLGFDPQRLKTMTAEALGDGSLTAGRLTLRSVTGRELPSGAVVRWGQSSSSSPGSTNVP